MHTSVDLRSDRPYDPESDQDGELCAARVRVMAAVDACAPGIGPTIDMD